MLSQSQINQVFHDWIQTLTGINGANIRPQRNRFGFNLVDNQGNPLAFDTTICMFYAGLSDNALDRQFTTYDNVSLLKSVSLSITFIGEDADIYANTIQSLAYGITSRAFLRNYGFALQGNIGETINDKEYSEKWFYRRTLNATFNVVVEFTPQNAPTEFNINTVPINVLNNEGVVEAPEIPPVDPVQYYKENRNPNWLNMLGTGFGENYDEMEQYYESQNNEIRLLFLLYPPNDNLIAFTVGTQTGQYTVSYTQIDGTQVTQSVRAGSKFEANLDYNNFGYEFDMQDNTVGTGSRQVLITITGNNITNFSLQYHSLRPISTNYNRWNIAEFMSKCTYLSTLGVDSCNMVYFTLFGSNNITSVSSIFSRNYLLEAVLQLDTSNVTSMSSMFYNCYSLQSIPPLDTSNVTNMLSMFNNCYSLQTIPLLDTSNVTSMAFMFSSCYSLQTIPLLDTSNVTNMQQLFYNCGLLQTIPPLDTSNVTNMYSIFQNCRSLIEIPQINTDNVTNAIQMFSGCYNLKKIPLINTSKWTSTAYMFYNCYSLQSIPPLDTSNVTNMSSMFNNCYSLQTIPLLDTSNVTDNMDTMFFYCQSLSKINLTTTQNCTSFSSTFTNIYACTEITGLDFSSYTSSTQISLANLANLSKLQITATNWAGANITINNCSLGYDALLTLLENLPPVTANPTFTMTNNIGSDQLASEVSAGNPPPEYTTAINNGWTIAL